MWFYYIPFLALTVSFTIPYLEEKLSGVTQTDPGTMSSEYEDWLASTLSLEEEGEADDGLPKYVEPSVEDLLALMEAEPLMGEDWYQDPETLVTPLSLEKFWNAYWANDAPFYINAIVRDVDDKIKKSTPWGPPTPGNEEELGQPVIEERMIEKKIRNRVAFAPDYAMAYMRFSLIEKSDTRIIMKETHA